MATPKKRYKYTIFYTDGSFMTFELTKEDYAYVEAALCGTDDQRYAAVSIGVIGLEGVRGIIEQKEEEPEMTDEPKADTLPALDQESYNWIKQYMGGDN